MAVRRCKRPHCTGSMADRAPQADFCSRKCGQAHWANVKANTSVHLEAPKVRSVEKLKPRQFSVELEGVPSPIIVEAWSETQARTRARMRHTTKKEA